MGIQLGSGFEIGTVVPFIDHESAPSRNLMKELLDVCFVTCQLGYVKEKSQLPEDREGFRFRGGHVALDLTATLGGRLKETKRELLATPADLDRWLTSSGLATRPPHSAADDVQVARDLREAIYAIASGDDSRAARDALNAVAALPAAKPRLTSSGRLEREGSATELLATAAREAAELLGSLDRERIRQCEGDGCAILFLDLSRSGERRWCSMAGCGNRAKARAFRDRKGAEENGAAGED